LKSTCEKKVNCMEFISPEIVRNELLRLLK
jgi:hypothetical protein